MSGSVEDTGPGVRISGLEGEVARLRDRGHTNATTLQSHETRIHMLEEDVLEVRGAVFAKDGILSELAKINRSLAIAGLVVTAFLIPILLGVLKLAGWIK